ncbi:hypothetical protein HTV45_05450 [Streptomyces sp. CHD11]|uniref:hypothetical protein n=1 Tax=Streptomyces sp. CHD11 TaxID=2741325 RepID=UPI001BFC9A42|nr:hypothetical protein [Streptomyces sp. CHD11]MBT3150340.1 hypothetical protein [Streptomyces sp. CHD11]
MTDHRLEGPGENGAAVPRDLPDQQAGPDEDPWEVAPAAAERESERKAGASDEAGSGPDVPDTDEAGTGRQGAPQPGSGNAEQPVPEEPSA